MAQVKALEHGERAHRVASLIGANCPYARHARVDVAHERIRIVRRRESRRLMPSTDSRRRRARPRVVSGFSRTCSASARASPEDAAGPREARCQAARDPALARRCPRSGTPGAPDRRRSATPDARRCQLSAPLIPRAAWRSGCREPAMRWRLRRQRAAERRRRGPAESRTREPRQDRELSEAVRRTRLVRWSAVTAALAPSSRCAPTRHR